MEQGPAADVPPAAVTSPRNPGPELSNQQVEQLVHLAQLAGTASARAAQWVFVPATLVLLLGAGMIGYALANSEDFTRVELQTVLILGAILAVVGLIAVPSSFVQAGKATDESAAARGAKARLSAYVEPSATTDKSAPQVQTREAV